MSYPLVLSKPIYMEDSECGYCKGSKDGNKSSSIYTQVELMSSSDYDELINQGWRRSGSLLYKKNLIHSCCKLYTIRTNLSYFKPSKMQRKTINRFAREIESHSEKNTLDDGAGEGGIDGNIECKGNSESFDFKDESNNNKVKDDDVDKKNINNTKRVLKGNIKHSNNSDKSFNIFKLLHSLKSSSNFHTTYGPPTYSKEKFELYKKYQTLVHNDEPEEITPLSFSRFLCENPFPEPENNGREEEWDFLNNWVKNWTNEEEFCKNSDDNKKKKWEKRDNGKSKIDNNANNTDVNSDINFKSNNGCGKSTISSLRSSENLKKTRPRSQFSRIGPTHECWYLNGKLIALSILDFLPSGVSSIYFIWDPDYAYLSLGTISSIKEILMCDQLNLGYYYLGYYIEDCQKMKYKANFGGQLLDLCNEVYFPLDLVKPFIKNDQFFVIEEKSEEGELYPELEIENNGHPIDYIESDFNGKELINTAEKIYGSDSLVYSTAEEMAKKLLTYSGVKSRSLLARDLPQVVPGIIPLWQIVEWLEDGSIDDDLPVELLLRYRNELIQSTLGKLDAKLKHAVLDTVRVLGLEKFQKAIVIV